MIRSGDPEQWTLLIGCLPMLKGYVRPLVGSDEEAKEILQEASVRLLAAAGPDDPERYTAWARGVVRQVIAHDGRARRRARAEQPFEEKLVEGFVDPPSDPEAHLDARAWVERIKSDLDGAELELLYRRYVLQESGRELADDLASSPAAMRMRLMRLRSSVCALARRAREVLVFAATLATAGLDDVLPSVGAAADLV
jgi:RNA polymerase sigma factor (sigma-70 family)